MQRRRIPEDASLLPICQLEFPFGRWDSHSYGKAHRTRNQTANNRVNAVEDHPAQNVAVHEGTSSAGDNQVDQLAANLENNHILGPIPLPGEQVGRLATNLENTHI